jgi:ligand-binding sensor domain-containing protein
LSRQTASMNVNRLRCILPLLVLLFATDVLAQADRWETYTSFRETNDLLYYHGEVWVASSGGVYRYDVATGERSRYTVVDGLHGIDARALAYDESGGFVWIGYADGVFDRLSVETGVVRSFFDIQRADRFPSRGITGIQVRGDTIYLLTEFGIVVFDARRDRMEVRDTYTQLGTDASRGVRVNELMFVEGEPSRIYAATTEGISHATIVGVNLQDPSSWTFRRSDAGAGEILSLRHFEGDLHAGAQGGLFRVSQHGAFQRRVQAENVRSLQEMDGRLVGVDRFRLLELMPGGTDVRTRVAGMEQPTVAVAGEARTLWVGDAASGVAMVSLDELNGDEVLPAIDEVMPQGPYHGRFASLHMDAAGNLWAGGTLEVPGTGVYRLDQSGTWTSFVARTTPEFQGRSDYSAITSDQEGSLWAGSWGHAIMRIGPDDSPQVYDQSNSTLRPIRGSNSFTVVGGVTVDPAGNLWATNIDAPTQMVRRSADGDWASVQPACPEYSTSGNVMRDIYADSYGNLWSTIVSEVNYRQTRGLLVYDPGPARDGSDAHCRYFRAEGGGGQGLPSIAVHAVAEDRDGRMWVVTNNGPAFTPNSRLLPQSTGEVFIWPQPADRDRGAFLFYGVRMNAVAVDASNRVWLGTDDQGVYVIKESPRGGFDVVAHFTQSNSPLLSDRLVDIAADGRTGRV